MFSRRDHEAKRAFEKYASNRGVTARAYHADNGIFKATKWMEECYQQKQNLTFAGVNAHHQNGIAERRIRELQETTRAMLYTCIETVVRSGNNPSFAIRHANGKPSLQLNATLVAHRQTKSKQNIR